MKKLYLLLFSLATLSSTYAQYEAQNQKFDAMIQRGMKDWKIPGLATVVVKDGQVVFQKTYGIRDLETQEPVDEQTLFSMASTTKAIIAISLGMLVDQGKLDWNDKVRDHLPSFELSDPYITADARIQDLLTHNLGISPIGPARGLNSRSDENMLQPLTLAERIYPLRSDFRYSNTMYIIAGQVIHAVSGLHWSAFVKTHLFDRLEMERSTATATAISKAENRTCSYYDDPYEGMFKIKERFRVSAAGGIWSSISDISNYLLFLNNKGILKTDTLLQPATFEYLFKPHAILPRVQYPAQQLVQPNWVTYGLGWFQQDYRGGKMDFHTGSTRGMAAIAGIMHKQNTAVYVFANLDHAELRHAILYKAMDLYVFNDDSRDWHQEIYELYSGLKKRSVEASKKLEEQRVLNTNPSLPLKAYVGTFQNELCGSVTVSLKEGRLHLDFNGYLQFDATHWHYDTFKPQMDMTDWYQFRFRHRELVQFNLDQTGKANEFTSFGQKFSRTK